MTVETLAMVLGTAIQGQIVGAVGTSCVSPLAVDHSGNVSPTELLNTSYASLDQLVRHTATSC